MLNCCFFNMYTTCNKFTKYSHHIMVVLVSHIIKRGHEPMFNCCFLICIPHVINLSNILII